MIKARLLALALLPCFLTACGGGSPAAESMALVGRMADAIESVKSKDDIPAAKEKLDAIGKEMKALKPKVEAMSAEDQAAAKTEMGPKMATEIKRMTDAIDALRAKSPELSGELQTLMATVMGNM